MNGSKEFLHIGVARKRPPRFADVSKEHHRPLRVVEPEAREQCADVRLELLQ